MEIYLKRTCEFFINSQKNVKFKHAVIITEYPKDDDFVEILRYYAEECSTLTIFFKYTYYHDLCLHDEIWTMMYKYYNIYLYVETCTDIITSFNDLFLDPSEMPTRIVTDNEKYGYFINKKSFSYIVYPENKICRKYDFITINALQLAPLDNIDKDINLYNIINYALYDRRYARVPNIIDNLPSCYILFTAFGSFRQDYNYAVIIEAFYDMMRTLQSIAGSKILLILQDEFGRDEKYREEIVKAINSSSFKVNVRIVSRRLEISEKKALLRMSYALIYLNESQDANTDLRLSLMVGTPVIALGKGFAKRFLVNEETGFVIPKLDTQLLTTHMSSLTFPVTFKKYSDKARKYFIENLSITMFILNSFDREDAIIRRKIARKIAKTQLHDGPSWKIKSENKKPKPTHRVKSAKKIIHEREHIRHTPNVKPSCIAIPQKKTKYNVESKYTLKNQVDHNLSAKKIIDNSFIYGINKFIAEKHKDVAELYDKVDSCTFEFARCNAKDNTRMRAGVERNEPKKRENRARAKRQSSNDVPLYKKVPGTNIGKDNVLKLPSIKESRLFNSKKDLNKHNNNNNRPYFSNNVASTSTISKIPILMKDKAPLFLLKPTNTGLNNNQIMKNYPKTSSLPVKKSVHLPLINQRTISNSSITSESKNSNFVMRAIGMLHKKFRKNNERRN